MHRIEAEDIEDSSELDPRAPGVWALGSLTPQPREETPAGAPEVLVHVRDRNRPHKLLRFARACVRRRGEASAGARIEH
jgi:hypothetical protein